MELVEGYTNSTITQWQVKIKLTCQWFCSGVPIQQRKHQSVTLMYHNCTRRCVAGRPKNVELN